MWTPSRSRATSSRHTQVTTCSAEGRRQVPPRALSLRHMLRQGIARGTGLGNDSEARCEPSLALALAVPAKHSAIGVHRPRTLAAELRDQRDGLFTSTPVTVTVEPVGQLLYGRSRDGAHATKAMRTNGRRVQEPPTEPGDARQPALRRGGWVAFASESESGGDVISWFGDGADADDTRAHLGDCGPAWSPDGGHVASEWSVDVVSQVSVACASGEGSDRKNGC